jgi:hypothetical protein
MDGASTNGGNTAAKLLWWIMGGMGAVLVALLMAQYQQTGSLVARVAVLETEMRDARADIKETKQSLLDPSDEQLRRWRRDAAQQAAGGGGSP